MKITKHNNMRILIPSDGMVLTDGVSFAPTEVVLPPNADLLIWREITEAEAQEIVKRMENEDE